MANVTQPLRKVIWAVDPFEGRSVIVQTATRCLRDWLHRFPNLEIEPVYVLSPAELNVSTEFAAPWIDRYEAGADRALTQLIESLELPGCRPPRVLLEDAPTIHATVMALGNYGLAEGADAIVASTHGRSGFRRALMGSFAETLLLYSVLPVLVAGPKLTGSAEPTRLLFPTEFSEGSRRAFEDVVDLAKAADAKLTLFHEVPHPVGPVLQSGAYLFGGSWIPVDSYFTDEFEIRRQRAQDWVDWASHQGVESDFVLESQSRNIALTILAVAQARDISLIAMEAQSGPVSSALIGSITRQVVRASHCPVWVIGPQARSRGASLDQRQAG